MIDLHTHHQRCGHASGSLRDYVMEALDKGVRILGLSDHSPMFSMAGDQAMPRVAMPKSEFGRYVAEAVELKAEFVKYIEILVATEADFFEGQVAKYTQALQPYSLDYLIGSVHMFEGRDIFDAQRWTSLPPETDLAALKARYYRTVAACARSGAFHVIGHVDALKGSFPGLRDVPAAAAADEMLTAIRDSGAVMEINTSGSTKACGGWYPEHDILERAKFFQVPITFASDAHVPERVADQFGAVSAVLEEIGFTEWSVFHQGMPRRVPFGEFKVVV